MADIREGFRTLLADLDRKGELLQRQQVQPDEQQVQPSKIRAGWEAGLDEVAALAGVELTRAPDGAVFEALPVPQAKQTVRKLETVLDWEHNRQTIESGLESTQGLLLALCGIAARTRHMWKPLAALIGIAACSALVGWLSGRAAFVQAAAVAVILAASAAVAAGVVHWRLAAGLERLELDMGMLKTHAQQAGALAAELQSLALRRSQQLVTAMQDELRNTHWQAQHALVCVLLRERAGGAQAQAAAAGP
ncbi:hypothetical protein COHA_003399 [Chlorella ohadii]|uniref:Uncharacterized protein n=1 Tax=Chlorella ohadii TaxID=2649997 RepID=A0AAD5H7X6_9CHLO|nr:hypothetical protein COHA_003399 [Chlorella ohadii]